MRSYNEREGRNTIEIAAWRGEVEVNDPLSYGNKLDWGNKMLPPKYVKLYGFFVLFLMSLYLWKFHERNSPIVFQAVMGVVAISLAAMLVTRWNKNDTAGKTLFCIMFAQCIAQFVALLRYW
jgi:predicted CDP-diglyceride synthetase/phosphatidate cytidylyltransferase